MLVSHQYKFIFIKTAKTAGTSIESYFERFCMPGDEWEFAHARSEYESEYGIIGFRGKKRPRGCRFWNHMSAGEIKSRLGDKVWDEYFKFTAVRNPYDKLVSAFFHRGKHYQIPWYDRVLRGYGDTQKDRFSSYLRSPARLFLRRSSERKRLTLGGSLAVDDWIRFEDINGEIARICPKIGVSWEPDALPHLKGRHRDRTVQLRDLYDSENVKLVFDRMRWDFETFGYDRELPGQEEGNEE